MIRRLIDRYRFMREHRWTEARFSAYLDRELDDGERVRLERHAGLCPECHRMLEALKQTLAGLRGLSASTHPPSDLADSVIERLRKET